MINPTKVDSGREEPWRPSELPPYSRKVKIQKADSGDLMQVRDDSLPDVDTIVRAVLGIAAVAAVVAFFRRGAPVP